MFDIDLHKITEVNLSIYVYSSTGCFVKLSLHSLGHIDLYMRDWYLIYMEILKLVV